MKILILGGTGFLGRHIVDAACKQDHRVTIFNRGITQPELFPDLEQIHGDRKQDLERLRYRSWDAVIDVSGRIPKDVRASARLLADVVQHYTFISSVSVYADFSVTGIDENAVVEQAGDANAEEVTPENYGALKVLCEQAAAEEMAGRALVIRPGLIVGPYDTTDRFTYWPHRVAQGGEVLAPDRPENAVQFIDVRDLAEWTVRMVEKQATGTYNAKGPERELVTGQVLDACKRVSGSDAHFTWVSEDFLLKEQVEPYTEMPLWVPSDMPGFSAVNCSKAIAAGLTFRELDETIQATLAWDRERSAEYELRAGLKRQREDELLSAWYRRS